MTSYRLLDTKGAKSFSIIPIILAVVFLLASLCIFLFLLLFVKDLVGALACLFIAILFAYGGVYVMFTTPDWYGRYAMLEGDLLKVCTKKGKIIRTYRLRDMDKICAFVSYGQRGGLFLKGLLLYEKGLYLNGEYMLDKEGYTLRVNFYRHSRKEQKKMVIIQNKALEEKILAYYGEQPIECQE